MPFEDVHRLVTTMRMAELILNDRVQVNRKDKMAEIKTQLDADHCPNMAALLDEFQKAKAALTQTQSFRSIGAFDADAYDLEGLIIFETVMHRLGSQNLNRPQSRDQKRHDSGFLRTAIGLYVSKHSSRALFSSA